MSSERTLSYRTFGRWWRAMVDTVAHDEILTQVNEDGRLTYSYAFMVVISAGIAMIGLLLNSPAVIIGAMLVSPLMGPIVLTGIAISTVSPRLGGTGALGLLAGIGLALLVSVVIVYASPLNGATPEILARTRPNLFDLLVAIFSGLAGGYAVIRGRGSTIVGVAIATALMPPLAVVGYGIATAQWEITRGASLLFVTNMLAIGLSVAFVATWYGFGRRGLRQKLAWQSALALLILVPLAIPLVSTLRTIAQETYITNTARQALEQLLVRNGESRISQFQISFPQDGPVLVEAVLLTRHPRPNLMQAARDELEQRLHQPVRVQVEQVPVSNVGRRRSPTSAIANPVQPALLPAPVWSLATALRKSFPVPVQMMDVDERAKRIQIMPKPGTASLPELRQMESELTRNFPGWAVAIIPPAQSLPPIRFLPAESALGPHQQGQLADLIWALRAWHITRVRVTGFASSTGSHNNNASLALARARQVAAALQKAGIEAQCETDYPAPDQHKLERQLGYAAFRVAEVRLPRRP